MLERRGPLPSGAPSSNAPRQQVVRWLLDNLHHEAVVAQLAQKLPAGWDEKGSGGSTSAKTRDAVNKVLDALEALPLQEPPGGGEGEHLPKGAGAASGIKAHAPCPKP